MTKPQTTLVRSAGHYWATIIAEAVHQKSISKVCIAPGSRSTPLVKAFHDHPDLTTYTHYDERSLGFFALGMAKQSHKPVVIITTSGTAVANLVPAVAEADKMQVPLIVISADRPDYLHHCGANQTMSQEHIFLNFVRASLNLPTADFSIQRESIQSGISELLSYSDRGPVHINMPIDEPLLESEFYHDEKSEHLSLNFELSVRPIASINAVDRTMLKQLCNGKRVLCISAMMSDAFEAKNLIRNLENAGIPILAECTSPFDYTNTVNRHVDAILKSLEKPDVIVAIGSKWLSKKLHQLLKETETVILLHDFDESQDFLNCATYEASIKSSDCDSLLDAVVADKTYTINEAVDINTECNDVSLIKCIDKNMSNIRHLFCGNSMPIRHVNQYFSPKKNALKTYANRGVSGIDGIISSAAGVAMSSNEATVLINGDMSSLHDLNGLYFLKKYNLSLLIIVINNNGGSIFSKLPVREESDIFEPYFTMPHGLSFKKSAELFDISYDVTSDSDELDRVIKAYQIEQGPKIIEWIEND